MTYGRGWLLPGYLIFIVLGSVYGLAVGIPVVWDLQEFPDSWLIFVMVSISALRLVSAIALWLWKPWGFHLYALCTVVGTVAAFVAGRPITPFLFGFIGVFILYFLLRRARPDFLSLQRAVRI